MRYIHAEGVNEAYHDALRLMLLEGVKSDSRNGPVFRIPGPVITEIDSPRERVLFSPLRDANPFFHFMEAMWMLAGRNDVEFVAQFNSKIAEFSDNGDTFHGAYGHRWRNEFGVEQLWEVAHALRGDHTTRRCVLQMWSAGIDLGLKGKDFPCNTHVYFDPAPEGLNMTVCNRSNDIIWGLYGANFVHMSFLHEYICCATGMKMGKMYTLSNNFHLYPGNLKHPVQKLFDNSVDRWYSRQLIDEYPPLFVGPDNAQQFLEDAEAFCRTPVRNGPYVTEFFNTVAVPMYRAWQHHKNNEEAEALECCGRIESPDWERACSEWLLRRYEK